MVVVEKKRNIFCHHRNFCLNKFFPKFCFKRVWLLFQLSEWPSYQFDCDYLFVWIESVGSSLRFLYSAVGNLHLLVFNEGFMFLQPCWYYAEKCVCCVPVAVDHLDHSEIIWLDNY